MSWAEFTNWIEESRGAVNDSIQFVRAVHLNHAVPVYDASIPAVRNFAIGSDRSRHSIVVHNSEYMFIDDSACNLASVNLMKFRRENGTIDDVRLRAASHIMITAQEILVDMGSYPTAKIAENSHRFRPLGLGFCNLGSLLMACGAPYDSDRGRSLAACVTAILHGQAYATSADHAWHKGPFAGFAENRAPMLRVIRKHQEAVEDIDDCDDPEIIRLKTVARGLWKEVVAAGETHGFRNSQVTVIAPTGTIAFMMDADTTGIEPDVALVKYKNLAGRGQLKIVNQTVPLALKTLGYSEESIRTIWAYMERHDTIEGCPALRDSDLAVFDCAFKPLNGRRSIAWDGHVRMMAAVQPFVSGAISKTVNMDREATIDDIRKAYLLGWKLGLKALAIYRDGSKWSQPVGMSSDHGNEVTATAWTETEAGRAFLQIQGHLTDFLGNTPALYEIETVMASVLAKAREAGRPVRRKLPKSRDALHHRFEIRAAQGPAEGYIGVGFYPGTRTPGEIFITMSKEGSTVSGLMDILATLVSIGLQYGVPLDVFVKKFAYTRFEPSGLTDNHEIPLAYSVADPKHADAIRGIRADSVLPEGPYDLDPARFLVPEVYDQVINGFSHGNGDRALSLLKGTVKTPPRVEEPRRGSQRAVATQALTGPECARCKSIMVPAGPCYRCIVCGNDVGGCG
jgi:ribonucleoside-diphosphate reductase alpha chain